MTVRSHGSRIIRRSLAGVLAGLMAMFGTFVLPRAADATEIPNTATTGFMNPRTDTQGPIDEFTRINLTMDWAVPAGTQAGDTIRQLLPAALLESSLSTFNVTDGGNNVLAVATMEKDPVSGNAYVVFTFTDYVEQGGKGASGTAKFSMSLDRSELEWDNGTTVVDIFGTPITVRQGPVDFSTKKNGTWTPDQATATAQNPDGSLKQPANHMIFAIYISMDTSTTEEDNWTVASFTEAPQNGMHPNCAYAGSGYVNGMVLQVSTDGGKSWPRVPDGAPANGYATMTNVTCNADGSIAVTVTKSATDLDRYYRVMYHSSINTDASGRPIYTNAQGQTVIGFPDTYVNHAEVTVGGKTGSVDSRIVVRDASAGGTLLNDPAIDIEKYSATPWAGVQFDASGNPDVSAGPAYEPTNLPTEDFDTGPGKELAANQPQTVYFTVTNIGSEALINVVVSDTTLSGPALTNFACTFPDGTAGTTDPVTGAVSWGGTLARQGSFPCTATLPAMGGDAVHADTAKVTANGAISTSTQVTDEDDWHAYTPANPDIDIEKYNGTWGGVVFTDGIPALDGNGQPTPQPTQDYDTGQLPVAVGAPTTVTFTITNTGDVPLTNIVVSDATLDAPALTNIVCTFPDGTPGTSSATGATWAGPLAVGATFNCTATLPAMAAGELHRDNVTVTGTYTPPNGGTPEDVDDEDEWGAETPANPDIDIEKYNGTWGGVVFVNGVPTLDANGQPTPQPAQDYDTGELEVPAGTPTTVTFTITNTGDVPLTSIVVADTNLDGPALTNIVCTFPGAPAGVATATGATWAGPLAVGATFNCTATLPALTAGQVHHDNVKVTGTYTPPGGGTPEEVEDDDTWGADTKSPKIDIEKYNGTWGGVVFTDGIPALDGNGQPTPQPTQDYDTGELEVAVGTPTAVTFTITNTGDVPLTDIVVADTNRDGPALTNIVCTFPAGVAGTPTATGGTWPGPFLPGASFNCTATLPAMTAGQVHHDNAAVSGIYTPPGGTPQEVGDNDTWGAATKGPKIDVEKYNGTWGGVVFTDGIPALDGNGQPTPQPTQDYDTGELEVAPGTPTAVTFTITNTGDAPLTAITIADSTIDGPALTNIVCTFPDGTTGMVWAGPLVPGATFNCIATLPALTAGQVHHDNVTVTGVYTPPTGPPTTVDDDDKWGAETKAPEIDIEKYNGTWGGVVFTDGIPALDPNGQPTPQPTQDYDTGELPVTANVTTPVVFTITNTGDAPLTNVVVTDTTVSGPALIDIVCTFPDGTTGMTWAGPFVPAATFTCAATLPGMAPGSAHHDTASVTGVYTPPTGPPVTVDDEDNWGAKTDNPQIDVEKYSGTWGGVVFIDGHPALDAATNQPTPQPSEDYDTGELEILPGAPTPVTFTITNTGDAPLTSIIVTDTTIDGPMLTNIVCTFPGGATGTTWAGPLAPAATFNCTATLPALVPGQVHHDNVKVTGTYTPPTGPPTPVDDEDKWGAETKNPKIDIEKYNGTWGGVVFTDGVPALDGLGEPTPQPSQDYDTGQLPVPAGTPTAVTFTITNTGDVPLTSIIVADRTIDGPALTNIVCTFPGGATGTTWAGPLAVGATFNCIATLPALAAGQVHHDNASVIGTYTPPTGPPQVVNDDDTWGAEADNPKIDIEKYSGTWGGVVFVNGTASLDGNGQPLPQPRGDYDTGAQVLELGAPTVVTFTVTNTGNRPLTSIVVSDATDAGPALTNIVCTFPDGTTGMTWAGPLAVAGTFNCTGTLPGLTEGQQHNDTATVTGIYTPPNGPPTTVTDRDTWGGEPEIFADTNGPVTPVVPMLPNTGADPLPVLRAGLMLLAVGVLLVALGARRRRA